MSATDAMARFWSADDAAPGHHRNPTWQLPAVVASAFVALLAGCIAEEPIPEPEAVRRCLGFGPSEAWADTPSSGGDGPRRVTATLLAADGTTMPDTPAAAWWNATSGPEGILVRTDALGNATFQVPASVEVRLLASSTPELARHDVWDMHGVVAAGTADLHANVVGILLEDSGSGIWSSPVSIGAQTPVWQPLPLVWAEAGTLSLLAFLELRLEWTNGPQGGADFGIAVGAAELDRYWNQEYQANVGTFSETLRFDLEDLDGYGWTEGTRLQAGPSISTGGFALTGIPFGLTWTAAFEPATLPCGPAAD